MIELQHLSKEYNNNNATEHYGVFDINLKLPSKGLFIIEGKSGCGKTTLLNILGCIDNYESGSFKIYGNEVKDLPLESVETLRANDFSFIFQDYRLFEDLDIYNNVKFNCKKSDKVNRTYVRKLIGDLGLGCSIKKLCKNLSGGEKQRVAIARALIKDPKVILADEPTGNLDSNTSIEVMNYLKEESKSRLVIVVSHNHELAKEYGDTIIYMKDGHIINIEEQNKIVDEKEVIQEIVPEKQSFKKTFKNIASVLGRNTKANVVFTILETFLMLFCLITVSMFNYNSNKVLYKSLTTTNEYISTPVHYENKVNKHYYNYNEGAFVSLTRTNELFYPVIPVTCESQTIKSSPLFIADISNCNYSLASGRLPSGDDEIIISDYLKTIIRTSTTILDGVTYSVVGSYTTSYSSLSSYDLDFKKFNLKYNYGVIYTSNFKFVPTSGSYIESLNFLNQTDILSTDLVNIENVNELSSSLLYGNNISNDNEILISKDYFDSLNVTFEELSALTYSYDFNSMKNVAYNTNYSPYINIENIKVVGVVDNASLGFKAYVNENMFNEMYETNEIYFVNHANVRTRINNVNDISALYDEHLIIDCFFYDLIEDFTNTIGVFKYVSLIISIILFTIIFLLLFKDFKNLFVNKRQEMGIMMTLGIHQKDITIYTALHYAIYEFIGLVVSSLTTLVFIVIINNKLILSTYMFNLLNYPYIAVIVGFVCLIGVALLLAYLGFRKLKENRVSLWMKNSL